MITRAILATALLAVASPALAERDCFDRQTLIGVLQEKYDERQMAIGLVSDELMVEVYISPAGTWTLVAVGSDNGEVTSCVLTTGTNWRMIADGVAG